ncbi:MAG: hypothetical protein NXI16_01300 [Alphaproteobacteria bacterium]|nr:hypothetical protein [Alphaproteobacteria bacterium]
MKGKGGMPPKGTGGDEYKSDHKIAPFKGNTAGSSTPGGQAKSTGAGSATK